MSADTDGTWPEDDALSVDEGQVEQALRWRLILGRFADDRLGYERLGGFGGGAGGAGGSGTEGLIGEARRLEVPLQYIYDREQTQRAHRQAGAGSSGLSVPMWLSHVRELFPQEAVHIMEQDALMRYGIHELVTDPAILRQAKPSDDLLKAILQFKHLMKGEVLEAAREVVRAVVAEISDRLLSECHSALQGAMDPEQRPPLETFRNTDWKKTILRNLKNFDAERNRLVIDRVFYKHRQRQKSPWRIIVAVDQSGSMTDSLIHSSVMAAIFASLPSVAVNLVLWDTRFVDVSEHVSDPLEVLMTSQLGGGTDPWPAMVHCASLITEPARTIFVVLSDWYMSNQGKFLAMAHSLHEAGVLGVGLSALDSECKPVYDEGFARQLAGCGWFVAALTPKKLAEHIGKIVALERLPMAETTEGEEQTGEAGGARELGKADRAKLERMGEAFDKIDRLLFRVVQQGLQRMSRSSAEELRALEQLAHNAALITVERQIETLATHVQRYLDKDPLFTLGDYMTTINRIWLLSNMARKRHARGESPDQMVDLIGEARRSYLEVKGLILLQPLGASGWVTDTDFVGITIYFHVDGKPGVIYQASNCKPCAYFGRSPQRLLHEAISEYVEHTIFDMAHGAFEFGGAKLSSDGRLSLHRELRVAKAPYIGARAYAAVAVKNWVELVDRLRASELHPIGGAGSQLVFLEPSALDPIEIDEKNARATFGIKDNRGSRLVGEILLRPENNFLVDNLETLLGRSGQAPAAPARDGQGRRIAARASRRADLLPDGLFGRAWVEGGQLKFFPFTALYNQAVLYKHDRRVNEIHLSVEAVDQFQRGSS